MNRTIDTDEQLMAYAAEGRLTKHALSTLLTPEPRRQFLDACAKIEEQYTVECAAAGDPCLASGCSSEGEICLQPLLAVGSAYHKACGAQWNKLFALPGNRMSAWAIHEAESQVNQ